MTVTAVLFDLGNVLIRWDPETPYRSLIPDADARRHFMTEVCPLDWHAQSDAGRPWAEMIEERIALYPQHAPLIRAWRERFNDMVVESIPGTVRLLEQLEARGMPLYALTNWAEDTFAENRPRFPFLEKFRHIVVSGAIKMMKPDPAIYHHTLEKLDRKAGEILFIDDSAKNIAAARDLGFHTHHFVAPEALEADLKQRGLIG